MRDVGWLTLFFYGLFHDHMRFQGMAGELCLYFGGPMRSLPRENDIFLLLHQMYAMSGCLRHQSVAPPIILAFTKSFLFIMQLNNHTVTGAPGWVPKHALECWCQ